MATTQKCFFKHELGPRPNNAAALLHDDYEENKKMGYDPDMAKELAYVSAWCYSDEQTFIDKLKDKKDSMFLGGDCMGISVVNDAMFVVSHAYIVRTPPDRENKRKIIVCFRGTEIDNVVNWLTNSGTRKVGFTDSENHKVHSGFKRNWHEVWDGAKGVEAHLLEPHMLQETFDEYYDKSHSPDPCEVHESDKDEIYLTGHSLGGAMAIIAGLYLKGQETEKKNSKSSTLWKKVKGIYTFGQPMVVCEESREDCQKEIGEKVKRFVYFNDVVPHLPPLTTGVFDHIGDEFKYMPDSTLLPWPHRGEWRRRRDDTGNLLVDAIFRPRSTQVVTILGALPFCFADYFFYNVQWVSLIKMPWSLKDHIPSFYVHSFDDTFLEDTLPEEQNSGVIESALESHTSQ